MDDARRTGAFAGIVFSILSLCVLPFVALPVGMPPVLGGAASDFTAWYAAHRFGFLLGNYLGVLAFVPGFVQLAILVAWIRRHEGEDGWLWLLVACTGTFTYAVFACSLAVFQVLPFASDPEMQAAMATLAPLTSVWFSLDGLAALPFVVSVGWAARVTGALPSWVAPISGLVGVLAFAMSLGGLAKSPDWLAGGGTLTMLGFVAFFAWTFALAVASLTGSRAPPSQ